MLASLDIEMSISVTFLGIPQVCPGNCSVWTVSYYGIRIILLGENNFNFNRNSVQRTFQVVNLTITTVLVLFSQTILQKSSHVFFSGPCVAI